MTIKQVRQYWNRQPCNINHSRARIGTALYFEQVRQRRNWVEPHILGFVDPQRWRGNQVLEIGCGIGADAFRLVQGGAQYTGMDLSARSVELTKQHLDCADLRGGQMLPRLLICNVERGLVGLGISTPDLIYSFGVIHHTPHPHEALRAMRMIARPGWLGGPKPPTQLRIMLYHRWSTKVLGLCARAWPWRWGQAIRGGSEAQPGSPVTWVYSRRQARRLLRSAGWEVQSIQVRHIFPYRVAEYKQHRYVKRFPWNIVPTSWFERWLGWHLLIVAVPR